MLLIRNEISINYYTVMINSIFINDNLYLRGGLS